jgi:hypothetical protein
MTLKPAFSMWARIAPARLLLHGVGLDDREGVRELHAALGQQGASLFDEGVLRHPDDDDLVAGDRGGHLVDDPSMKLGDRGLHRVAHFVFAQPGAFAHGSDA